MQQVCVRVCVELIVTYKDGCHYFRGKLATPSKIASNKISEANEISCEKEIAFHPTGATSASNNT